MGTVIMNRTFFIFITLFAMTLTAHASPHKETGEPHNHKWKFSVTAGSALIPSYRGDDEYRYSPLILSSKGLFIDKLKFL